MIEGFNYRELAKVMEREGILNIPFLQMDEKQVDSVIDAIRRCLPPGDLSLDDVPF